MNIWRLAIDEASGAVRGESEASPDDSWLSARIQDPGEDLVLLRPDGTQLRRLTDDKFKDRNARWSPDASYLPFLSNRGGAFQCWSIRSDGSGLKPVAPLILLTWRPDGGLVAYAPEGGLRCFEPAGPPCPDQALPAEFLSLVWSPHGERVAGRFRSSHSLGFLLIAVEEDIWLARH